MTFRIRTFLAIVAFGAAMSAFADNSPTLNQVYQAARSGHLDQAEQMMTVVLQQHPNSAKAHYVDAEILAREGKLDQARGELATARQYDSALSFATPGSVNKLESQLAGNVSIAQPMQQRPHFPWGLFMFGIAAILGIFWLVRMFTARQRVVPAPGPYYSGYPGNNGFQPGGYPGAPYGGGPVMPGGGGMMSGGSGIVSSLVTGAAVGAGMVAGEELAHHLMDGGRANAGELGQADSWNAPVNGDMGGNDFGVNDAGSWDSGGDFGGGDSGGDWT